jgi:hypothetical protein
MRPYHSVAKRFFALGALIAIGWQAFLSVSAGLVQPRLAIQWSFPGAWVPWPGVPLEGATGGMVWVMFLVTAATNGVIYALIAVGISSLMKRSSSTQNSH